MLIRIYCQIFVITLIVILHFSASTWHCFEVLCVALVYIYSLQSVDFVQELRSDLTYDQVIALKCS